MKNFRILSPLGICLPLFSLIVACSSGGGGGGGGNSSSPNTTSSSSSSMSNSSQLNSSSSQTSSSSSSSSEGSADPVAANLKKLGFSTYDTPREASPGEELGDDFAPLGSVAKVNKLSEIMLFGVPIEQTQLSTSLSKMAVTNLIPGGNNSLTWELLAEPSQDQTPWTANDRILRHAALGDFDNDGIDEVAVVYQDAEAANKDVNLVMFDMINGSASFSDASIVDTNTWSFITTATGDFDGDGDVDIALGMINTLGDAQLKLLINDGGSLAYTGINKSIQMDDPITLLILKSGNLDYDKQSELALVVNSGAVTVKFNSLSNSKHRYYLLDDAKTSLAELKNDRLLIGIDSTPKVATTANLDLGDVDGDGVDEVVLGGLNQNGGYSNPGFLYLVQVLDDAKHNFAVLAEGEDETKLEGENLQPSSSGASMFLHYTVVVTADVNGDGAKEFLVNQHLYQSIRDSGNALAYYDSDGSAENGVAKIPTAYWFVKPGSSGRDFNFNWETVSAAAADVSSDGRENIVMYSQRDWTADNQPDNAQFLTVWGDDQIDGWKAMARYETDLSASVTMSYFPQVLLGDFELDDNSATLQYSDGSHDLVFTEPLIIAVLAAAPCNDQLGQDLSDCRTAYGTAVSDSSAKTNGQSLSAKVSVGLKVEDPFTSSGASLTAGIESTASKWSTQAYSLTKTLLYETGPIEDSVVLATIPMDIYTYTVLSHPDPLLVNSEVQVHMPRDPITVMVSADFYNQNRLAGSPEIDMQVLTHTEGDPSTYMSRSEQRSLLQSYDGVEGSVASVGQGGGRTQSSINEFSGITNGNSSQIEATVDYEATAGFIVSGLSVGFSSEKSIEITHGEESIYQGTVGNISAQAFENDEGYNWGIFSYLFKDNASQQEFEVINYWVE